MRTLRSKLHHCLKMTKLLSGRAWISSRVCLASEDIRKSEKSLTYCWWWHKTGQLPWKAAGLFVKATLMHTLWPYSQGASRYVCTKACTRTFIVQKFIIDKNHKQCKHLSKGTWLNKRNTLQYQKRNQLLT